MRAVFNRTLKEHEPKIDPINTFGPTPSVNPSILKTAAKIIKITIAQLRKVKYLKG